MASRAESSGSPNFKTPLTLDPNADDDDPSLDVLSPLSDDPSAPDDMEFNSLIVRPDSQLSAASNTNTAPPHREHGNVASPITDSGRSPPVLSSENSAVADSPDSKTGVGSTGDAAGNTSQDAGELNSLKSSRTDSQNSNSSSRGRKWLENSASFFRRGAGAVEDLAKWSAPKLMERFSADSVVHNPQLAKAARKELVSGVAGVNGQGAGQGQGTGCQVPGLSLSEAMLVTYADDLARQLAAVQQLDSNVAEEARSNGEVVAALVQKMDSSRRALEGQHQLLQSLASAEYVHISALTAACSIDLGAKEQHSEEMAEACRGLAALPQVLRACHQSLHRDLTAQVGVVSALLGEYREACKDVLGTASMVQRSLDSGRASLQASFKEHQVACHTFDTVLAARATGRLMPAPENDTWASESQLLQEHKNLHWWLAQQRHLLKKAFDQLVDLEQRRTVMTQKSLAGAAAAVRGAIMPLTVQVDTLQDVSTHVAADAEVEALTHMAKQVVDTAEQLAHAQADTIQGVCDELFSSPEIIRQGPMKRWNAVSLEWIECHFVLTRAGFLHWFRGTGDLKPMDSLCLARCQYEAASPPLFNITEAAPSGWLGGMTTRKKKCTFQALSIEDCCEWTIALRDAIALASGRQHTFEEL